MTIIKLQSGDGRVFDVNLKIARASLLIKQMFEDLGESEEDEGVLIPLRNVDGDTLDKVITWLTHHKDDPAPTEDDKEEKRTDDIPGWDADFLNVDQKTLTKLVMAANFLDIKGLYELTCKALANMIKGKAPEEIRKMFNIQNDLTSAEEEQIRKENGWCEEK